MRRIHACFAVAALWLFSTLALAQTGLRTEGDVAGARGVYEAEVPVNSQSEADRNAGFARALAKVLTQLSGDRSAMSKPGAAEELRKARDYVSSYDFRQDQGSSPGGAPTFRTMLVARFKPADVDALAGLLGLQVWPQPRPKPVVWLAIDDGSGPRLVGLQQINAARPLLNRAVERGFKLGLPAGNAAEQALAGAIWRQDTAAVARASARYQPPMQLVGKLYRSGANWKADWVFVDSGKVLSKWSEDGSDARRVMASGADGAADALIRRYAKRGSSGLGAAGTYRVAFEGLRNADDYLRLAAALQGNSVVRRVVPVRATAERYEVDLELKTGLPGFERLAGDDAPFARVEGDETLYRMK